MRGALDDAPMMGVDRGINQIAAQPPEPRERALLVRAGEPAIADHVGNQDCSDLARLRHSAPSAAMEPNTKTRSNLPVST